jgi:Trk-type K+ transport system membrane component
MKNIFVAITLFIFIFIGGFGFVHMYLMEGHMAMPACPFMPGHDVVCTMDALGHIETLEKSRIWSKSR